MRRVSFNPVFILATIIVCSMLPLHEGFAQEAVRLTIHHVDDTAFPEVHASLTAADASGLPIQGLQQSVFSLTEENQVVERFSIQELTDDSLPITVVLVIDASASMADKPLEDVKIAAQDFVTSLSSSDQVGVVVLSGEATLAAGLTQDKTAVSEAIALLEASGRSPLYDAIVEGIQILKNLPAGRKAIIVLSDGHDDGSTFTLRDAVEEAELWSIPIYPIGFGVVSQDTIERIAGLTGGYAQIHPDTSELLQAFDQVLQLLRHHYVLEFTSQMAADGTQHTLTIALDHQGTEYTATHSYNAHPGKITVNLESIADEQSVGGDVRLKPIITAPAAVSEVRFDIDGELIQTVYDDPFSYTWDTTGIEESRYTLTVTVKDEVGNSGNRSYRLTVRPAVKVTWSVPVQDANISSAEPLQAEIDSLAGVSTVAYFVDDNPIGELTSEPYTMEWSLDEIQPGAHVLRVVVTDVNNQTSEAEIDITVSLRGISPMLVIILIIVVALTVVIVPTSLRRRRRLIQPEPGLGPAVPAAMVGVAHLVEVEGVQPGRTWPLRGEETRIGRKRDSNEIHAKGRSAGRQHAVVRKTERGFILFNLNPQNPTYINNQPVNTEKVLSPGDILQIGDSTFRFEAGEG